jgi:phage gpG-like protein
MGIEFNISGTEKLKQSAVKFKKAREGVRDAIYQLMLDYGNLSKATIQKDFLSGPNPEKLKVRSNRLRSSIRFQVQSSGDKFALIMGTDVPYAAIHEFGGITKPHEIRPKRKGFLAFQKGGEWRFTRKAIQHPGSKIPARPFLRPGLEQNLDQFQRSLMRILKEAALGAFSGE